jgi:predicted SAM-dependent methyltransferase
MYEIKVGGNALELGGGNHPLGIGKNIDIRAVPGVDIVCDLSQFPWPLEAESIDTCVGLYIIEHCSWQVFPAFVKELQRILRPGSRAIFLTSNLEAQCKRVIREGVSYQTIECIFATQDHIGNFHSIGFSESFAKEVFKDFDVKVIAPMPDVVFKGQVIYSGSETDMIIELTKPLDLTIAEGINISGLYVGVKEVRKECLNLGSFTVQIADTMNEVWVNIDIISDERMKMPGYNFMQMDLRGGLLFPDDSKDRINMSHLLEHFTVPEGIMLLKACYRVLRQGGEIRVCVPDIQVLVNAYVNRNMSLFDSIQPEEYKPCTESEKLWRMITSGPPDLIADARWEGHKTAYDSPALYHALKEAGFTDINTVPFDKRYDTFPEVAVVMTAKKPTSAYVPPHPEIQGKVQYEIIIPTVNKNITVSENKRM